MNLFNRQNEKNELIVINFARLLFIGLIIFELLNYLKILQFSLEYTWLGLLITALVLFALLEFVAYKYKQIKGDYLHWSIWLIVAAGLSLDACGDFFHFYGKYDWWDQTVHYFVCAVIAFTLFTVISAFWIDKFKFSLLLTSGRLKLSLLLASTSAMSLAALYEIEEYAEDLLFHTHRLGPGADTANDLLMDLLGILTAVLFIAGYYLVTHKRKIVE